MSAPPNQESQDEVEAQAAATPSPGLLCAVWAPVPDIQVGPYSVRRFVDSDFKRLAQLGHPLNSLSAIQAWKENPTFSGPDAYLIIWLMTRSVAQVNSVLTAGPEAAKTAAEEEFSEQGGLELGKLVLGFVAQLNRYFPMDNNSPSQEPEEEAAGQVRTPSPGARREAFAPVPDIEVGTYKVRRFVDSDFMRLAKLGHPLNSFNAATPWLEGPDISGQQAWIIDWMMTRPVQDAKELMKAGTEAVRKAAEAEFGGLNAPQLMLITWAVVKQLGVYMGAKPEPTATECGPGG